MEAVRPSRRPRALRLFLFTLAVLGVLLAAYRLLVLTDDVLQDVRAYYDAGARLNAGLDLYVQGVGTDDPDFYRYPPLLAIAFRPLALLPYPVAAIAWEVAIVVAFALALRRLGFGYWTWIWLGILAMPIVWSVTIGQAQVLVTALLMLGTPWAVALAGHLKLLPFLVSLYWIGRRDWPNLRRLVFWSAALGAVQLLLEPRGTLAYLSFPGLSQVGNVNNFSVYAISPAAWAVFVVGGVIVSLLLARTRWGWPVAVAFSVLATPRLITYQLMALLGGLGSPDRGPEAQAEEQST